MPITPNDWRAQPEPELMNLSETVFQEMDDYVATRVFPNVAVDTFDGRYGRLNRDDIARDDLAPREPGSQTKIGTLSTDFGLYSTKEFAEALPVPMETKYNASNSLPPQFSVTRALIEMAMNKRESRFVNAYFRRSDGTNNLWGINRTGVASDSPNAATQVSRWERDNSTPIDDILALSSAMKVAGGKRPNKLIINDLAYNALATHPDILERITGGSDNADPANVMKRQLAALFRIDEVIVGDATRNTAKLGAAGSYSRFLGNHALLVYTPPNPGILTAAAGYHFTWSGYRTEAGMDMDSGGYGHYVDSWYDDDRRSELIRVSMRDDPQIVNNTLGAFIENVVS